jgi:hypothetical protein
MPDLRNLFQINKPNIADTLSGLFENGNGEELTHLRQVLEIVNANVTKSLLEDNLKKWSRELMTNSIILDQLAKACPLPMGGGGSGSSWASTSEAAMSEDEDDDDEEEEEEEEEMEEEAEEEKKKSSSSNTRVRTLISDDQASLLKSFYSLNPKPKREDLQQIADNIGHPFKVIKVWFQNTRARDRREGRNKRLLLASTNASSIAFKLSTLAPQPLPPPPPPPLAATNHFFKTLSPLPQSVVFSKFPTPPASLDSQSQQNSLSPIVSPSRPPKPETPLDLTTKRSTPSNSPPPLVINSDPEDDEDDEDDDVSNCSSPPALKIRPIITTNGLSAANALLVSDAKAQFEKMINEKLVSLNPQALLPTKPIPPSEALPNTPLPMAEIVKSEESTATNGGGSITGSTSGSTTIYSCDQCDKTFTKKSSITRHKYEHSGRNAGFF